MSILADHQIRARLSLPVGDVRRLVMTEPLATRFLCLGLLVNGEEEQAERVEDYARAANTRREILAMPFFDDNERFVKIKRCCMLEKDFQAAGSQERVSQVWGDIMRRTRFYPPQRPQADPQVRYDRERRLVECVQVLRPLDWLPPNVSTPRVGALDGPAFSGGRVSLETFQNPIHISRRGALITNIDY